jgi:hypothetical protein
MAVALAVAAVVALGGCVSRGKGSAYPSVAATQFLQAVAAGDVAKAQAVSQKQVSESDLSVVRKALFESDSPIQATDIKLDGSTLNLAGGSAVYFALYTYSLDGAQKQPGDDASFFYEIVVDKRSDGWVVVSWTGSAGVVRP